MATAGLVLGIVGAVIALILLIAIGSLIASSNN
jgi:hypothetical protein